MDLFNLHRSLADFLYLGLFWFTLPVLLIAAGLWGGKSERLVAGCYVAALAASKLLKSAPQHDFFKVEAGLVVADAALLAALIAVAARYGRSWVILVAAFQLLSTLAHFARLIRADLTPLAYSLMESASSYPALILLAVGIVSHHRSARGDAAGSSSSGC